MIIRKLPILSNQTYVHHYLGIDHQMTLNDPLSEKYLVVVDLWPHTPISKYIFLAYWSHQFDEFLIFPILSTKILEILKVHPKKTPQTNLLKTKNLKMNQNLKEQIFKNFWFKYLIPQTCLKKSTDAKYRLYRLRNRLPLNQLNGGPLFLLDE